MNIRTIKTAGLITLGSVLVGCGPLFNWKASTIPSALDTDNLMRAAAQSQGLAFAGTGEHGSTGMGYALQTERFFEVTMSSGKPGQLLAAYRGLVKRAIEGGGGNIHGYGLRGTEADVGDFSFDYTWGRNAGVVNVYSFLGSNSVVHVVSVCYEHRK